MKNKNLLNYLLMALAVIMLIFTFIRILSRESKPMLEPITKPTSSPFASRISGIGIIEPSSETIQIGSNLSGVIKHVHVKVGEKVTAGQSLFQIDDREINAQLKSAQARLATAKVDMTDKQDQFSLYQKIIDRRAISTDEYNRRRFAVEAAAARLQEAQAEVNLLETQLDRLTVRAPIAGQILKVDIRGGEFAPAGVLASPLISMGDTQILHIRVEIDETDAARFNPQAPAVATLRGHANTQLPLKYVRTEPLVAPKRNTNNAATQLIDTRILQIIYAVESPASLNVGQQADVFIEASPAFPAEVN